jgi:AmiR/NasT family two-component response regulator
VHIEHLRRVSLGRAASSHCVNRDVSRVSVLCVMPGVRRPSVVVCAFHRARASAGASSFVAGYLVDPASSHMLVSKIKPCMSKYKRLVL